jgi:hypothetical protein
VVYVSARVECRMKAFTRGPTKSHSNNNIEKPETHLSQGERRKDNNGITFEYSVPTSKRSESVPLQQSTDPSHNDCPFTTQYRPCRQWLSFRSTVQALQRVTVPSQHSTGPADSDCPFPAQYRPCRQWLSLPSTIQAQQTVTNQATSILVRASLFDSLHCGFVIMTAAVTLLPLLLLLYWYSSSNSCSSSICCCFYHRCPHSTPGQCMWHLWWKKWLTDTGFSPSTPVPPVTIIPLILRTHSLTCRRCNVATDCIVTQQQNTPLTVA